MPLYQCEKCGCAENTALGLFWTRHHEMWPEEYRGKALCSECGPPFMIERNGLRTPTDMGKWHGQFEKKSAVGMLLYDDGFLYTEQDRDEGRVPARVQFVREIE